MEEGNNTVSGSATGRLAKNALVYLVGNLSSKLLQVLILPVTTSFLLTEEYGYYNLIVTSINLVTPLVTFQLAEAMFRNLFYGTEKHKRAVLSSVAAFLVGGMTVLVLIVFALSTITTSVQFPVLVFLNYVSYVLFMCLQKVARSERKNFVVAVSGVLNTVVMLFVQLLCLVVFGMGADGMLIANFTSYFVACAFLEFKVRVIRCVSPRWFDWGELKGMLKLSAPLVPNSVCWWFVSTGNGYIVTFMLSAAANGIYAIASSFSQMLSFATSVFQMAWQESSIMESDREGRDRFYTRTFNAYMRLLLGAYLMLIPLIRLTMPFLVAEDYQEAYLYVPPLVAGAVFSAFSQFYGSSYLAFKKTGGAISTTLVAAIINVTVCVLGVGSVGLFAPACGSALAFAVQWIIRMRQMRDYFHVKVGLRAFVLLLVFCAASTATYYVLGPSGQLVSFLVGSVVALAFNRELVGTVLQKFRGVVGGK